MSAARAPSLWWIFGCALAGAVLLGLLIMAILGAVLELETFFQAYLIACLFWLSITLGSLAIYMIHELTGGAWGHFIKGVLQAAVATLPLLALLFIPLGFAVELLYPWAPAAAAKGIEEKLPYLNTPFFLARTAVYFLIWIVLAAMLRVWSRPARRLRGPSAAGLILYSLTVTFFAIDWVMSLEPHWYSTAIGFLTAASQLSAAMAFAILIMAFAQDRRQDSTEHFQDLGNLLLASVMFWAYIAFMQYLIIWAGNLPHEISWYVHRSRHGWGIVALVLVSLQFAIPFMLLLSRHIKRSWRVLMGVTAMVLFARLVDVYWLVKPAFQPSGVMPHWVEPAVVAGVGGLWLATFLGLLRRRVKAV